MTGSNLSSCQISLARALTVDTHVPVALRTVSTLPSPWFHPLCGRRLTNTDGFGGSRKIFLMEFAMPMSGKRRFNSDMPGIWLLNAQIPLTSQYGTNSECSCWTSGCGEFDLFEVLDSGNFRCKSTLHMTPAGGSSDWFQRPVKATITAAVVFAGGDDGILVKVLDEPQDFGGSIDDKIVQEWLGGQCSTFKMQT